MDDEIKDKIFVVQIYNKPFFVLLQVFVKVLLIKHFNAKI